MKARHLLALAAIFTTSEVHAQEPECVPVASAKRPRVARPLDKEPSPMRRVAGTAPASETDAVVEGFRRDLKEEGFGKMKTCYERSLQNDPGVAATYVFDVEVSPSGALEVSVVGKEMMAWARAHGDLSSCLTAATKKIEPRVRPGCGTVVVRFKVVFQSS